MDKKAKLEERILQFQFGLVLFGASEQLQKLEGRLETRAEGWKRVDQNEGQHKGSEMVAKRRK
jgi:hypothetical protein